MNRQGGMKTPRPCSVRFIRVHSTALTASVSQTARVGQGWSVRISYGSLCFWWLHVLEEFWNVVDAIGILAQSLRIPSLLIVIAGRSLIDAEHGVSELGETATSPALHFSRADGAVAGPCSRAPRRGLFPRWRRLAVDRPLRGERCRACTKLLYLPRAHAEANSEPDLSVCRRPCRYTENVESGSAGMRV